MDFSSSTDAAAIEWIVPDFILSWKDASCDWTLRPYRRTFASGELTVLSAGRAYGFLMVAPARKLEALTFDFSGPMRAQGLWVELRGADGPVLRRAFVDATSITTYGQAPVMDLSGLDFDIGAKLHVRMQVVALSDDAEVYVAATPQPADGLAFHRQVERLRNERLFVDSGPSAVGPANVVVFAKNPSLAEIQPALSLLDAAFPGESFTGVYAGDMSELWRVLETAQVAAFADFDDAVRSMGRDYDRLCFELNRRGVCTVALDTRSLNPAPVADGPVARAIKAAIEDQQRCRFILRSGRASTLYAADRPLDPLDATPALGLKQSLSALRQQARAAMLPKVAIVSVLGRESDAIEAFLEHVDRQTYPGEIVTVLVDDGAAGPVVAVAEAFRARRETLGSHSRSVRILRNPAEVGRLRSLANGLQAQDADICVIMESADLINRDFVAGHVFEHALPGVQVVLSRPGVEAADPAEFLAELERTAEEVSIQPADWIDAAPRVFSIKRQALPAEGLLDADLQGPPALDADLGWSSAETAYRLYARGCRVGMAEKAFSVRPSRTPYAPGTEAVRDALRTFEQLFVKHEDLALVGRRWAVNAFDRLVTLAEQSGAERDETRRRLEDRFAGAREWQAPLIALMRGQKRRLRVLSYRWHAPHQYELYRLPHDFTLVTGTGDNGLAERWPYEQRPLRPNARLTPASEIDPADYDVALLHFDENVLAPELCNNTIPAAWGDPFQWLLQTDLPKVAICHGTPQFVGQYGADGGRKAAFDLHEDERVRLVALLAAAGVHVICNSHQAQAEWGFASSQVIWHGFDPQEFPEGRGDLDVLALDADPHRPHYRGAWEQIEVEARLDPAIRIDNPRHFGGALEVRGTNPYARARFRAYAERIGRFKAYLNTTLRSPMPRSRGEAMMTGAVPVCLDNHDVSRFIENGVDGFHADEPAALADFLNHLCRNEGEARRMRAAARRKALDVFNHDRYLTAWAGLLERVAG